MARWKWEGKRGRSHSGPSALPLAGCWDCVAQNQEERGSEAGSGKKSKGGKSRVGHVEFEMPAKNLGGPPSEEFSFWVWRPGEAW